MDTNREEMIMSTLGKTWLFDLDGTIVKHNGYKLDGKDCLLDGVKEYLQTIPNSDFIIFLTSRTSEYKEQTIRFLVENEIRYNHIIFDLPYGERILVNDRKPSGLDMSIGINIDRNQFLLPSIKREL